MLAGGRKRILALLAAAALGAGLVACGSGDDEVPAGSSEPEREATLVLDYLPGAVHAGIYLAVERGYYEENGIDLRIIQPTSTADTLKLIQAGKAEFGIADGVDLGTQISMGRDVQAIMALTQRPAGGVITMEKEGITDPAQLEGQKVGVTGVPSDTAVLDTVVSDAGGAPEKVRQITIGFNGVQALLAGKITAFTGFIPADAAQIEAQGSRTRSFPLDEYGGPSYPGLVAFSTESRIGTDPDLMQGFVDATTRGCQEAIRDPAEAVEALLDQTQGLDRELVTRSLNAWKPLFGPIGSFGRFNRKNLEELASFMVENGLAEEAFSPDRYANTVFTDPR